jgi:hypothetical protein
VFACPVGTAVAILYELLLLLIFFANKSTLFANIISHMKSACIATS